MTALQILHDASTDACKRLESIRTTLSPLVHAASVLGMNQLADDLNYIKDDLGSVSDDLHNAGGKATGLAVNEVFSQSGAILNAALAGIEVANNTPTEDD